MSNRSRDALAGTSAEIDAATAPSQVDASQARMQAESQAAREALAQRSGAALSPPAAPAPPPEQKYWLSISFDLNIGVKHPGGRAAINGHQVKGSVRHEWSLLNGFDQVSTQTMSVGNVELVGIANDPTFSGNPSDLVNLSLDKVGGLKYDHQAAIGPVPVVVGGTADIAQGKFGVRGGIGTKEYNVYIEPSIDIDFNFPVDPDGGFNGAGMQPRGYGSANVPMDHSGYGPIDPSFGVGLQTGHEYNALDQISHLNALRQKHF